MSPKSNLCSEYVGERSTHWRATKWAVDSVLRRLTVAHGLVHRSAHAEFREYHNGHVKMQSAAMTAIGWAHKNGSKTKTPFVPTTSWTVCRIRQAICKLYWPFVWRGFFAQNTHKSYSFAERWLQNGSLYKRNERPTAARRIETI